MNTQSRERLKPTLQLFTSPDILRTGADMSHWHFEVRHMHTHSQTGNSLLNGLCHCCGFVFFPCNTGCRTMWGLHGIHENTHSAGGTNGSCCAYLELLCSTKLQLYLDSGSLSCILLAAVVLLKSKFMRPIAVLKEGWREIPEGFVASVTRNMHHLYQSAADKVMPSYVCFLSLVPALVFVYFYNLVSNYYLKITILKVPQIFKI